MCEVHLAESCDFTPTSAAPNTTLPAVLQTTLASKLVQSTAFHYQTETDIRPSQTLLRPSLFEDKCSLSLSLSLLHFAKFRLEHLRTYSLYRRLTGSYWINFERTVREEQLLMTQRLIHIHQRRYVRSQICAAQITDLI